MGGNVATFTTPLRTLTVVANRFRITTNFKDATKTAKIAREGGKGARSDQMTIGQS